MELKYKWVCYVGIIVILAVILIRPRRKEEYKNGKKIVGLTLIEQHPYYKRRVKWYRLLCRLFSFFSVLAMLSAVILLAQPYKKITTQKEQYNRDIILCMDISYSVDELNLELVKNLKDTVKSLKGERFGIVIFNSSAVQLSPLTDDYEYILGILDQLETSLKGKKSDNIEENENWLYENYYLIDGTLVGSEEMGSSLIGDGLASAVYNFPNLNEQRSRTIIFSTDNDLQGTPLVTLSQAADICKENHVTVYGIGTAKMEEEDMEEMKAAVTKTGGKFFLQEESGTVKQIVKAIEKDSKSLIKGKIEIQKVPLVKVPAIILFFSIFFMMLLMKLTRISER